MVCPRCTVLQQDCARIAEQLAVSRADNERLRAVITQTRGQLAELTTSVSNNQATMAALDARLRTERAQQCAEHAQALLGVETACQRDVARAEALAEEAQQRLQAKLNAALDDLSKARGELAEFVVQNAQTVGELARRQQIIDDLRAQNEGLRRVIDLTNQI